MTGKRLLMDSAEAPDRVIDCGGPETAAEFREALKSLRMTQRSLSRRLGVAVTTVNAWAVGRSAVPGYAVAYIECLGEVRRLAEAVLTGPMGSGPALRCQKLKGERTNYRPLP